MDYLIFTKLNVLIPLDQGENLERSKIWRKKKVS